MAIPTSQAFQMGLGKIGNPDIVHKRKFRWTFEVDPNDCGSFVPISFVKISSRPTLNIEEQEINFLNGKTWIPGKATWDAITVTYYDVANENLGLWDWIASIYDFTNPVTLSQATARKDYSRRCRIQMYDGCGYVIERWTLLDAWAQSINFGDLDYSSSEESVIEITLRYGQVAYDNACGRNPRGCCSDPCIPVAQ